ncbi:NAD(P)H-binding protein [Streptomyces sp. NBC_01142]|uniref:NAD(P)H-binding protein n=1 Tax=Streptomyces sp. NBC_01142 TaxID=2975865 RepID=UPI002250A43E|nr:NAD(P)H-binding protein [Streptomyces sp. NBC_01142]MCX4824933.1 NAD(P)H-binding protein [Streptomyces sp. NBC_01142]
MILVTGATGTVGRHVVDRLAGVHAVRVLARHPERLTRTGPQVQAAAVDYTDAAGLTAAMTGVRAALLITADPLRPEHDAHLVTAARAAGVRHLVKLSALAVADPEANDLITCWQRDAEDRIRTSGIAWTFLRPRSFMSNTLGWARSVRQEGVVRAPHGSAPNATVDPRDIADAAVQALTEPGHEGQAHALTGPEPLTPAQQTDILSDVQGRRLRFEELSREENRGQLLARYPQAIADALLESADRQRGGAKAGTDDTLPRLLGRPARTYRGWATDHSAAFRTGTTTEGS